MNMLEHGSMDVSDETILFPLKNENQSIRLNTWIKLTFNLENDSVVAVAIIAVDDENLIESILE